ncbi:MULTISPECIES: hypothetical protein [Salinibaculum]|uniref:hypothetical protein n=1 Tax=Salinibaculum TaxID=2732368 RepID=UPI0030D465AB
MDTLADVVAAGRDREGPVVDAPDRTADYTYAEFSTNAWKAGNLLRHYGVRPGATLSVVVGPKEPGPDDEPGWLGSAADPLVALLGGACLGAVVDLTPEQPVGGRAIVLPDAWLDRYEVEPGCSRLAYGGPPEVSGVAHFERELWSENPIAPPGELAAEDPLLRVDGREYTHGEMLAAAQAVVDQQGLTAADRVAIDAPLTTPGAVAAGVVAPLAVGATILLRTGATAPEDVVYVVGDASTWGDRAVDPATVP